MLQYVPQMKKTGFRSRTKSYLLTDYVPKVAYETDRNSAFRGSFPSGQGFLTIYFLACIGLENLSKFPILAYNHGGAAFIILYLLLSFAFAVPVFIIESGLSQFYSTSEAQLFRVLPYFRGLGWSVYVVNFFLLIPYSTIVSWALFYIIYSVSFSTSTWSKCPKIQVPKIICSDHINMSSHQNITILDSVSMFFQFEVEKSRSVHDGLKYTFYNSLHEISWFHLLLIVLTWCIIAFYSCIIVRLHLYFLYFLVFLSSSLLFILTLRFMTLPGAMSGVFFFLKPNLEKLFAIKSLKVAVTEIMFSICITKGNATFASLNPFQFDVHRKSYLIILGDFSYSLISGVMVFSMMGFLSNKLNISIEQLMERHLIFENLIKATTFMYGKDLWTFLFMFMYLTVGVTSISVTCASCTISCIDLYPKWFNFSELKKILVCIIICFIVFFPCIFFALHGSFLYLKVFTQQIDSFTSPMIMLCEVLLIHFVYGGNRLRLELKMMIGYSYNMFWTYSSMSLVPILILFVICYSIYTDTIIIVPIWAILSLKLITILTILPITIIFIMEFKRNYETEFGLDIFKVGMRTPDIYGPYYKRNWLLSKYYQKKLVAVRKDPNFLETVHATENLNEVLETLVQIGINKKAYMDKLNKKKASKKTIS